MAKIRRGGFQFVTWVGDHGPRHVHVAMKIRRVEPNNHKHAFDVQIGRQSYEFPYAVCEPAPSPEDRIANVAVDAELGNEGFTYVLESGREGTVHADHVLRLHKDPRTMTEQLLHKLTVDARSRLESSGLSKRALARQLHTSVAQLDRLLDTTNTRKTVDKLLELLSVLGASVDVQIRDREPVGSG